MQINIEQANGRTYYLTEVRGTEYSLTLGEHGWELWSNRKAVSFAPTFRRFNTLGQIEQTIKAFRGISQLLEAA